MPRRKSQTASHSPCAHPYKPVSATSPDRRRSKRGASQTPAKPSGSKRQPSEQLHMTTRTTNKAAETAINSTTPHSHGDASRRNSLNDVIRNGVSDIAVIERSVKHGRASSDGSARPQISLESPLDPRRPDESAIESPVEDDGRPNKRRRISTHATVEAPIKDALADATTNGTPMEVVEPEPASLTVPVSQVKGPLKRPRSDLLDAPPDLTDATSLPDTPEPPVEKVSRPVLAPSAAPSQEPTKTTRRMPGRRRAPHPILNVEVDLRRQLQLKTGYRTVAKALKPILAELAERSINTIDCEPNAHRESAEYEEVMNALDERLQKKLESLEHNNRMQIAHIEHIRQAESEIKNRAYELAVEDYKTDFLLRCQYRIMEIIRKADAEAAEDATADEDELVPRRKGVQYQYRDFGPLDVRHDSRSRVFVETGKKWAFFEKRVNLDQMRRDFVDSAAEENFDDSLPTTQEFVTFSGLPADEAEVAVATFNVKQLAEATKAMEDGDTPSPTAPVIPNSEATALQLLAEASETAASIVTGAQKPPEESVETQPERISTTPSATTPPTDTSIKPSSSPHQHTNGISQTPAESMADDSKDNSPEAAETAQAQAQKESIEPPPSRPPEQMGRAHATKINDLLNNSVDESHKPTHSTTRTQANDTPAPPPQQEIAKVQSEDESRRIQEPQPPTVAPPRPEPSQSRGSHQGFWSTLATVGSKNEPSKIHDLLSPTPKTSTPAKAGTDKSVDAVSVKRETTENPHMRPPPSRYSAAPEPRTTRPSPASVPSASPSANHSQPSQMHGEPNGNSSSIHHERHRSWEEPSRRASAPAPAQPPLHPQTGYAPSPATARPSPALPAPHHAPPAISPYPPHPQPNYSYQAYQTPYTQAQPPPPYHAGPPAYPPPAHQSPYAAPPPMAQPQPYHLGGPGPYSPYPPPGGYAPAPPPPPPGAYPPLRYAGSQYGQPILPANMDPRNAPHPHPHYSPYGPAFAHATEAASSSSSRPNNGGGGGPTTQSHDGGVVPPPKRRPRNYNTMPGSEFRAYKGPKQR